MRDNHLVLIDSSVWIDYFRGSDAALVDRVNRLLETDLAMVCGLVRVEVLPFFRKEKERETADRVFSLLPALLFREEDWVKMVHLQSALLKATGHPAAVPDLIISTLCIANGVRLYTLDSHFKEISAHTELLLYR